MAINNYPGVGPTNADIASTIATTPAVSSQITASVPTAAAIATAVAAPSAATIAAAVAAPSASTIATAVAAAVPTLSQINTSVATNAPSANNWTVIASATPNNTAASYTFSGLSGYKTYKIVYHITQPSSGYAQIRFNGDSASNYDCGYLRGYTSSGVSGDAYSSTGQIYLGSGTNTVIAGYVTINNATIGAYKDVDGRSFNGGPSSNYIISSGLWRNTASITSIFINTTAGVNLTGGFIVLLGAN